MPPQKVPTKKKTVTTTVCSKKNSTRGSDGAVTKQCGDATEESRVPARCTICEQKIVEGDEQALFCEGTRQQWVHRYCAGIPASMFASLSTSTTPFQYYACCQQAHAKEIAKLTEIVCTMKREISDLRNDLMERLLKLKHYILHSQRSSPEQRMVPTV